MLFSIFLIVNKSYEMTKTYNILVRLSRLPYLVCDSQPQASWFLYKVQVLKSIKEWLKLI